MILEIIDITEKETALGHVAMPPGMTLGEVFERNEGLHPWRDAVISAKLNSMVISNWQQLSPVKGDKLVLTVGPRGEIFAAIFFAIQVIAAVISVVQFAISLFTSPPSPKIRLGAASGSRESPTFSFEGIKTSFVAGNPVAVIYGEHRGGGMILRRWGRRELSMLLGT